MQVGMENETRQYPYFYPNLKSRIQVLEVTADTEKNGL